MRKKTKETIAKKEQSTKKSTFSKYRGIGNPSIGAGRQGIDQWRRELRGP